GKVLLPSLGEQYGQILESGIFRLRYERGVFTLLFYDNQLPVAPRAYHIILASRLEALCKRLPEEHEHVLEYRTILTALDNLPGGGWGLGPEGQAERYREVGTIQKRLATLADASPEVRAAVESAVELFNGKVGNSASFDRLDALIGEQFYRPAF